MPRSSLDKGSSKDRPHLGGGYIYRQTTVVREEADWRLFLTAFHYPHPDQRSTFPATKAAAVGDGGGAPLLLSRSGAPNPFDSIVRLQARIGQYLTCDARGRWLETRKVLGGPTCTMRGMRMKNSCNLGDGRKIVDGRKILVD